MAREHYFQICDWRKPIKPGFILWECKRCDTIVQYNNQLGQHEVNDLMTKRMPCFDPVQTGVDKSTIIDNRTINLLAGKPKKRKPIQIR